jgi:membrane-bound metal-dependent hydrolase YbcI (DUF457 family)
MDVLTHVFLPLTLMYAVKRDFDVFTGVHRGLFHSLVFLAPLSAS